MKARILFLIFLFLIFNPPIFSQEQEENTVYVINSFDFRVTGRTRGWALANAGDFIEGEEIKGFLELEKYINTKTQILMNQRVLESVSIEYTIGNTRADGKHPVDLVINVKDTFNYIVLPKPEYDSNSGFALSLNFRDYNFLGTMSPLRFDIGYSYDENGDTTYSLMLDLDIPVRLFNLHWNINFDHYFDYQPKYDEPAYYRNTTGLSVELPVWNTIITLGFDEYLYFNRKKDKKVIEGLYMASKPQISWKIPTGLKLDYFGSINYNINANATFVHEFPQWPLPVSEKGPFMSFGHNVGFGRVDWIGNMQKGGRVSVSNSYNYDFHKSNNDPLEIDFKVTGIGHFFIDDFLSISARLMYRQWFLYADGGYDKAADALRGILDKNITADLMLSLNIDVKARLFQIQPSRWFNRSKMRVLNFDVVAVPFLDMAIYRNPHFEKRYKGTPFTYKNLLVTGGMEVILFPEFFRSFFLRASIGFNLSKMERLSNGTVYIGTELFF